MDLETVSEHLFGRKLRLRVAKFILDKEDGMVFQGEIAFALRCKPDHVQTELRRLVALEMLTQLPPSEEARRVYYMRTESPLWEIVRVASVATSETA